MCLFIKENNFGVYIGIDCDFNKILKLSNMYLLSTHLNCNYIL